ncbi:STAS domain-containing protein [Virgisporangium aurantiacum]|uniref:Anti-sigma factor antagonist n=1 Tax=Virgisporangium aurantiacum TaxID=175570 RepID=A0A8J4E5V8_9ACTN|nr:STAS domain-containing protein [Virgisporangium aurantiacum]GIJ62503.1 hypothetical protein Vau01_100190 [Virgisporangium aurantiacum]
MSISTRRIGDASVVTASGELDLEIVDQLRACLREAASTDPERLVVDLTTATFVDSTILGALVGARNELGPNADRLRIVCSNPAILKTFQVTGLDQVFAIRPALTDVVRPT